MKASAETGVYSHQPPEHEAQQFNTYQELEELNSQPDLFDEPATQEAFISQVRHQLSLCAEMSGSVIDQSEINGATTHSPAYALDLVPDRRPNRNPKLGGYLGCSAFRGTFLFYDRLRHVALAKLDQDPTRLSEIANVLLSIYQCERRTFRYMAHVMLAAQQSHKMKQAIAVMDSSTAYVVFDFKQKFLAKGIREGGDSYYGKKVCYGGEQVCMSSQTVKVPGSVSLPTNSMWKWISQNVYRQRQQRMMVVCLQKMLMMCKRMRMYRSVNRMRMCHRAYKMRMCQKEKQDADVPEGEQDEDVPEGKVNRMKMGAMRMHKQMRICKKRVMKRMVHLPCTSLTALSKVSRGLIAMLLCHV